MGRGRLSPVCRDSDALCLNSLLPGNSNRSESDTMADEKETGFKVSDRRMFNPDGSPRQPDPDPEKEKTEPLESQSAKEKPASSDNVVSFPGAPESKRSQTGQVELAGTTGSSSHQAPPNTSQPLRDAGSQSAQAPEADGSLEAYFASLVNMLGVEAAMHLGLIESPMGGGRSVDLESAHHMIDMLGMLQQKTRGNLTPQEAGLLDDVLADLRMQFVAVSRGR